MNIKSIERVQEYAEVFTSKKDVLDVLSLVQHECKRIDSRFLEPACGTGNFLVEILNFKLDLTLRVFGKNQLDYERNSIFSLSTIYGIDILADNVNECRQYLLKIFEDKYPYHFIDFETSTVAIPFHKGMRPYEPVAFQFSHDAGRWFGVACGGVFTYRSCCVS